MSVRSSNIRPSHADRDRREEFEDHFPPRGIISALDDSDGER